MVKEKEKKLISNYARLKLAKSLHDIFVRQEWPWLKTLQNINQRCSNQNSNRYKYYGGRGIKCLISANDLEFLWHRDNASKMKQASIDRIDSNGHYELSNCRFIEMNDNRKQRSRGLSLAQTKKEKN